MPDSAIDAAAAQELREAPEAEASVVDKLGGAEIPDEWKTLRDRNGNAWNPLLHQSNPDGSPKLSKLGRLQGLGGRKLPRAGRENFPPLPPPPPDNLDGERAKRAQADRVKSYKESAEVAVDVVTGIFEQFGAKPLASKSRTRLVGSTARWFESRDFGPLPPGFALSVDIVDYTQSHVISQPSFRQRVKNSLGRGWLWIQYRLGRVTLSDYRDHRQREDDAGREDGDPNAGGGSPGPDLRPLQ